MNTTEIRFAIEIREDSTRTSPGRLTGTILNYNERASDRPEMFSSGALSWPTDGIIINRQHRRDTPIMRAIPEIRGNAVVIDTPLPDTVAGRDAATEIRSGLLRGLSVEFRALKQRYENGVRVIQEAVLSAAGLVDSPSYAGSTAEVRKRRRRRVWL